MLKRIKTVDRSGVLLSLFILGLITAIIFLPYHFGASAAGKKARLVNRTESADPDLPNYDIRLDTGADAEQHRAQSRGMVGKSSSIVSDIRDGFTRGEEALRVRIPGIKFEYNDDIKIPEVITPDVWKDRLEFLSAPAGQGQRPQVVRDFVKDNGELVGMSDQQADALILTADYTNPNGNLSFTHFDQQINGIPVFRGEIKAGFSKSGQMFRVINNLAPGLDYASLSTNFNDPLDAVSAAAGHIHWDLRQADRTLNASRSTTLKAVFGTGDWATTAEKMYFPTEPGVAVPAWRVLIWEPQRAFYVIVDAANGTMLWRKNITEDQTQSATYSVYANSSALMDSAENPTPISPGPIDPNLGTQGAQIARSLRTLIGNEGALSFNNLGWITDGANGVNGWTDGNACQAGLDIVSPDGIDASQNGTLRVFDFIYNPPPGMPPPPDASNSALSRSGAVTQLFYLNNRYHDSLYQLGFNEVARNFQNDNFTRGGVANDRVSGEAQDFSGTNNANFSTPADGGRGKMQMYLFTNTGGNRDGDLDAEIVVHEHTHGTSNRLIGNASGLTTNRARGMGEGWGDFYGLSLLGQASDPMNGIYTTGSYATFQATAFPIGTNNSYYGIRRFPYAVYSFTGGAGNLPHNPETAADVNAGCSLTNGAFPVIGWLNGSSCTEVHNMGEIWVSLLNEMRWKFITRLGFATGNLRQLQFVTDGMKMGPINPTMVQERDAIIAAALAASFAPENVADADDVREGFRIRGLGQGATDNGTTVVESFQGFGTPTPSPTPSPFTPSPTPCGIPSWTAGATLPGGIPIVRAVGNYFPANGRLYAMGGRGADTAGSDYTHPFEYNPATDSWVTKAATYPDNQVNNMACGVLTVSATPQIYCVGGSAAGATTATARVFIYNPVSDTLTPLTAADNWPGNTGGTNLPGGFAVFQNKLYIFGGFTIGSVALNTIYQFDPTQAAGAKWTLKTATLPVPMAYIPATAIGTLIFTGGGSTVAAGVLTDSANSYVYNPVADSISPITNIPRATGETRALTVGNKMWVLGGGRTAPNPSNQVNIYDPVAGTWSTGLPFTTARRNFPTDTDGSRVWLIAGYDTSGTGFLTDMERFSPGIPCGTPSPSPTPSPTPTPTPSPSPSASPSASPSPSGSPSPSPSCSPPAWSAGPAQTPARYAMQGAIGTDNMLYIAGGQDAVTPVPTFYSQVSRFNPATNTWSNVAPLPVALSQATTAAANGKVYVAGGWTGGATALNTLRIYDIATNAWSSGPNMPTANGVEAAAGAIINNKFYVMGGDDVTNGLNTNFIYDIALNSWSTGATLPDNRTNTYGTVASNGMIYVYGGVILPAFTATDTLLRYDPVANSWANLGSAGTGTRGNYGAITPFGTGQLLISDGADSTGVSTTGTHIFTISSGTFSAGPAMLATRAGHAQGRLPDGRVLVADGFNTATTVTSTVELLSSGVCAGATPTPSPTPSASPTPSPSTPSPSPSVSPSPCQTSFSGAITTGDPTQTGRLFRGGVASTCGVPNACSTLAETFHYDSYTSVNTTGSTACVTATLTTACAGTNFIFAGSYLNSFDPANICTNNMGDPGLSPNGAPVVWSFNVPAGATFINVISEVTADAGCSAYTLDLTGIPCGTPLPSPTPSPFTPSPSPTPSPTPCSVTYTQTTSTGATIDPGTTLVPGSNCDDCSNPVTLPFSFSFFGTPFTTVNAVSNGNLQFSSADTTFTNVCLPNATMNNAILPHWDDMLLTGATDGIYTSTTGSAPNRVFNIEWRGGYFSGGGTADFEARLFEGSNQIEFVYGTVTQSGSSATIGIQKATGAVFNQFECNTGGVTSGLKVTYVPSSGSCATPSPSPSPSGTPSPSPSPSCAPGTERIADGTFEAGSPWPLWTVQTSTNFGTPNCDAACGTGGSPPTAGPFAGANWSWFGGAAAIETATLGQTFNVPSTGPATLSFQMWIGAVSTPFSDTMVVRVDGAVVQAYTEPAVAEAGYTLRTIPLNFAATGNHTILFTYTGPTTGVANFSVDNISLLAGGVCATPTPSPSPSTSPSPSPSPTGSPTTTMQFASAAFMDDESQSATITVTRTGQTVEAPDLVSTVNYATTNGTAMGGAACTTGIDYITATGTLTFQTGETVKSFTVTLCPDSIVEPNETITLTLSAPTGGSLGTPSTATLTVNDTANDFRFGTCIDMTLGAPAVPYPANITVVGGPQQIGGLRVTLFDINHQFPDNIDVLLVGPQGQKFILMADAGGAVAVPPGSPVTLTFSDTAGAVLPNSGPLVTGNFEPTSWEPGQTSFPPPAPPAPYNEPGSTIGGSGTQTLMGNFFLSNSNGVWSLYVRDDAGTLLDPQVLTGSICGWGLQFLQTTAAGVSLSGRVTTSGGAGIRNANVVISGNSLPEPRTVRTGSFGYFSFAGLTAGETYVVTVNSQRYTFAVPSRVVTLVDNLADFDFQAEPNESR